MNAVKISPSQLFSLIFLFELGSAIVVGVGMQAKQDAWITILLGMVSGAGLFLIYEYLFRQYPNLPLTQYLSKILGKYIGVPLAFIYIFYFLYIAARVLRDFGDLLLTSSLDNTPIVALIGIMMLLVGFAVYRGIEVIGRTAEFFLGIMLVIGLLGTLFILLSDIIKMENLLPVLEKGWEPVLKTFFPLTLTFPFGEMIVFTMLLPFLNRGELCRKVGLSALLASGVVLCVTIIMNITVLGVERASQEQFPLLATIDKINVGNFIQRLDAFAISTLILGGFFKITVFFYAAFLGLRHFFNIKKHNHSIYWISILGIFTLIFSIRMSSNFIEHIEVGLKVVPLYLHVPLQVVIPLILLIVTVVRKRLNKL